MIDKVDNAINMDGSKEIETVSHDDNESSTVKLKKKTLKLRNKIKKLEFDPSKRPAGLEALPRSPESR